MNIRKNDTVVVISGNDADSSKTRKVLRVMPAEGKVVVEGLNNHKAFSAHHLAGRKL
jgi:ribosomal protein L24